MSRTRPGWICCSMHWRSSPLFLLVVVCVASFTDGFAYQVVVPILPFALQARARVSPARVQIWTSAFLAVFGAAVCLSAPILGYMADQPRFRRLLFLLGPIFLIGSTAAFCLGHSIAAMLVGRILQAISSTAIWVVGLSLLVDRYSNEQIGWSLGWVNMGMSLGLLVSPVVGGVLFDRLGYYSVFAATSLLVALDCSLRLCLADRAEQDVPAEATAVVCATEAVQVSRSASMYEKDPEKGSGVVPSSLSPLPCSPSSSVGSWDRRLLKVPSAHILGAGKKSRALPKCFRLLASRRFLVALLACFVQAAVQTALDAMLPILVETAFHWDAMGAGLIFVPLLGTSYAGPFVGWLADCHGAGYLAAGGFGLAVPSLVCLRLVHQDTLAQKVLLVVLLLLTGIAFTLIITPMMADLTEGAAGADSLAQACGYFNIAWSLGCTTGPLVSGSTIKMLGFGNVCLVLAGLCACMVLPIACCTGRRRGVQVAPSSH
ncbi:hypothetical protein LTR56_017886 [Elasticomyces elasticus]|nr:hypothetical protein LTR56_017886 [Elasticomyces elasticus]KAK3637138.1 hypothetical protein LTR22_018394 [Elasticomyces elasticus]KAK4914160.1 hypothetical protein LTR49_017592 [Elasticomyces elasticus]KAK5732839.1 hypothetical protein LTS12_027054 [Elasticomyces elasticus]